MNYLTELCKQNKMKIVVKLDPSKSIMKTLPMLNLNLVFHQLKKYLMKAKCNYNPFY